MEPIPLMTMELYQKVVLVADIMTINKICFHVSVSWNIWFGTGEMIENMKIPTMVELLCQEDPATIHAVGILGI